MTITSIKYEKLRPQLTDGCLLLMSKDKLVSKIIRSSDNDAEFSHIGIVFQKLGRWFIIDSNAKGVHPDLLSFRIREANNFLFIQPLASQELVNEQIQIALERADKEIRYDFKNGIKELINRRWNKNLSISKRDSFDICSDYTFEYAKNLEMVTDKFNALRIAFPQDYLRYNNFRTTKILR